MPIAKSVIKLVLPLALPSEAYTIRFTGPGQFSMRSHLTIEVQEKMWRADRDATLHLQQRKVEQVQDLAEGLVEGIESGAKSCACVDGILSVDPAGQVLPCSSFAEGIGSLLTNDFEKIYKSRAARYWREKRFSPPVCQSCPDVDICGGACPLYWDAAGSFDELPRPGAGDSKDRLRWERSRRKGHSFGVQPKTDEEASWAQP